MSTKTQTPMSGFGSLTPIVLELPVRSGCCPGPVNASCPPVACPPVLLVGREGPELPDCELGPDQTPLEKSSDRYPPVCSTCFRMFCSAARFTAEFCAEKMGASPGAYVPFFSNLALMNQGSRVT